MKLDSKLQPKHFQPGEGKTYRVEADTVDTTAARLAPIPVPTGRRYEHLTQIGLGPLPIYVPYPLASLAKNLPPPLQGSPWGHAFRLAWKLSRGVKSELSVVRRVEDFLLKEGRYRYTTEVGPPDLEPLLAFLFRTHAGYCQQFAGSAALLLRLAGVGERDCRPRRCSRCNSSRRIARRKVRAAPDEERGGRHQHREPQGREERPPRARSGTRNKSRTRPSQRSVHHDRLRIDRAHLRACVQHAASP